MLKAKDIMTKDIITVKPATTIEDLARILIKHQISGTPVVDEDGNLIGIVTENDLISKNKKLHIPTILGYSMPSYPSAQADWRRRLKGWQHLL
jgi:CBS-domain-containing membrane protein